jgi:DNA-binding SARP family transcriptional activator
MNAPVTPLRITLLGGFGTSLGDGPPLTLAQRKAQALLAYLAVPAGQFRAREELATLLWGDADAADARNSLRQTLFLIRRALPGAGAAHLTVRRDAVALEPATVQTDVRRFERRVAENTLDGLEGAVTLYRGDFLQGFALDEPGFEEWMSRERERLRDLVRDALARLLARHTENRRFERALEVGRRLLAIDPIDESTHRALMRLHARQGRHAAALRQYQLCVGVLARELGVEPDAETRELYRALVRERAASPPPVTVAGESDVAETPLIGRDAERRRLEEAVAADERGVIAILGDAGIGKTRLARELAAIATAAGAHVIVGRCHDAERILPFRPWVEALRNGGVVQNHEALAKLAPVWRAELGRLFPEIAFAGAPSAPGENVLQLFEALARLILDATVRGRLAIVLDDLQWADEMSLRFLSFLAHRIEDWPILVAVTARDEEAERVPLLARILRDLDREGRLLRLALVPLGRAATNTLVAALAPTGTGDAALAALGQRVWAVSEGNPFVAVEMMRAARTLGTLPELPHRVQDLIVGRLDQLSEPASEMAALAAVIGGVFDFPMLVRASGHGGLATQDPQTPSLDEGAAAAAVEELVRRRILQGIDDGFGFVHERVREVVYRRLVSLRRARLHRAVADAMVAVRAADLEPHHAVIGFHYSAAEAWEPAVQHLRAAGLAAYRRGACREAATCFTRAVDAHERLPRTDEWKRTAVELRFDLRHALVPIVEMQDVGRLLHECEQLATDLDDRPRLARAWAFLGHYHWWFAEHERAVDLCRRALGVASEVGDPALQLSTNMYLGLAFYSLGAYRAAARIFRALASIEGGGVTRERFGLGVAGVFSRSYLALVLAETGEFVAGRAVAEEAMRQAEPGRHPFLLAHAYVGAAAVHIAQGEYDPALRLFDWYRRHRSSVGPEDVWPLADWYAGLAYVRSGRVEEGLALLERIRQPAHSMNGGLGRSMLGAWLAEAYLAAGRPADALAFAEPAARLAHEHKERGWEAAALLLLGDIAAHGDAPDLPIAEQRYAAARALAEELGMRPLAARCALSLGLLHRSLRRRLPARRELDTAAEGFRGLGMKSYVDRTEAALGRL